jgi:hypothetical protein
MQGVASGIAGGGWFGRTQGLGLPPGVAAAQFGVGGDGQAPGSFGGVLPFLPGGYVLGEVVFSVLVVVAEGPVAGGQGVERRSGFPWREAVAAPGTPMATPGQAGSLAAAPRR